MDNFLNRLGNIFTQTQTACFSWALIPNHFQRAIGYAPQLFVKSLTVTYKPIYRKCPFYCKWRKAYERLSNSGGQSSLRTFFHRKSPRTHPEASQGRTGAHSHTGGIGTDAPIFVPRPGHSNPAGVPDPQTLKEHHQFLPAENS